MAAPTHLSHTINAAGHTFTGLQAGDLVIALIWQQDSGARTYNVKHGSGAVTWNRAVQKDQLSRSVAICWTVAPDSTNITTTVDNGGFSVVHNAIWIHARPPAGKSVFFGGSAGFGDNTTASGGSPQHCDVAGGFDLPADSITYAIGVTTANFTTATQNADFTLLATDNTRYLAQYRENSTALDGTRATWTMGGAFRFGPGAMLTICTARDTTKEAINDTLRLGYLGEPGSGATAEDNTRFDRDGTITGATWAASSGLTLARTGWQFVDGTTYINRATFTTGIESFAVGGWVRRTATGGAVQFLFYVGNSGANGYGVYIEADGTPHILLGGVIDADMVTAALPTIGTNYHVALTRIGGTFGLWVNGALIGTTTSVPITPTDQLRIGSSFAGWMGDAIYTRRIWSQAELNWLANSSNSLLPAAPAFKAAWARQANVIIGGNVA